MEVIWTEQLIAHIEPLPHTIHLGKIAKEGNLKLGSNTINAIKFNMKDDSVPEIVPLLQSKMQAIVEDIEKITIQQLFDVELPVGKAAIAFCTEAVVLGIPPHNDWYYMACRKCSTKVNEVQECNNPKCTKTRAPPIPRYRVTIEVEDTTSVTTFVLFDRHVMKMINVSAHHILNNDQNASNEMIPPILNNMLGKNICSS